MKNLTYFNVSAQQVANHMCSLKKIDGALRDATSQWLQVHDSATVAAEGAAPIKSWPVGGGTDADPAPFFQTFPMGELELQNGLYICLSTTDATKTLSADKMDLSVELSRADNSVTVVEDDTASGILEIWNEASGLSARKRLVSASASNPSEDQDLYLQIFAEDSPDGSATILASKLIPFGTTVEMHFGENGREMSMKDSDGYHYGCTIGISQNGDELNATGETCAIVAKYKTAP